MKSYGHNDRRDVKSDGGGEKAREHGTDSQQLTRKILLRYGESENKDDRKRQKAELLRRL